MVGASHIFRALGALLLLFAASPAAAQPAMWRIADEDTTIYLLGTVHVLPDGFEWRDARIDRAIDEADELVIETLMPDDPAIAARLIFELGMTPGLPPLVERAPAGERDELRAMIARGPAPELVLDGMETWAASLMLVGVVLADLGLDPANGVEQAIEARFEAAGKPISGLESPREQLGFFDALPEPAQRDFLASLVEAPESARVKLDAMLDAWAEGDEAAMAASFNRDIGASPALRDALLTRRNARWARWIAERMEAPGTVLLAVGAGHLAGRESVQDFLDEAGIEAERVD